ncbi:hypothetical protein BUBS_257 [Bacillus phage Bubs]|uniref:hypothetical protein n=1 Tax=Bacillus phage Nemo TaxID=1805950 RepID=UPI0007A76C61|nr:hypothetical protein BI006_gp256 [Bacillus phage Nemo]AMW63772.1 hypothetical protein NEMO_256 [Bacillus phage Nemo]ASR78526.1 hypothetical protein BUBS_257 [Bacillus phage Bubs]AXQ67358.1 hypothetical protein OMNIODEOPRIMUS_254 [Bacillus phage OmnioDeoPrimus]
MNTINGGQLYKVKTMGLMLNMFDESFMPITHDVQEEVCEYDVYEKVDECKIGVTLRHLQLDFEITITMDQLVTYFEPFNSHEVILRPVVGRNIITQYLKDELSVDDIDFGTGFVIKVDRNSFDADDNDVVVRIQYAKTGFRFRQFNTIARVMEMKSLLSMFNNPRNRYISDMNLFDRVTIDEHKDYRYFYGYSTAEGFCRTIRKNIDKQEFVLDRENVSTVVEFKSINIYLNSDELEVTYTKGVKEEENEVSSFNVINTNEELVFPTSIDKGLLVTFKHGTVHMLVNNLSIVKGATFNVIEINKQGKLGVWGSSFDSTMSYYRGLDKLQLQIVRIDSINDFSLVNKALLNK